MEEPKSKRKASRFHGDALTVRMCQLEYCSIHESSQNLYIQQDSLKVSKSMKIHAFSIAENIWRWMKFLYIHPLLSFFKSFLKGSDIPN